jgi:hypothetical protein
MGVGSQLWEVTKMNWNVLGQFITLLTMLHLNDTWVHTGQLRHDPIHKTRPILDHLNLKFGEYAYQKNQWYLMKLYVHFGVTYSIQYLWKGSPTSRAQKYLTYVGQRVAVCNYKCINVHTLQADNITHHSVSHSLSVTHHSVSLTDCVSQ